MVLVFGRKRKFPELIAVLSHRIQYGEIRFIAPGKKSHDTNEARLPIAAETMGTELHLEFPRDMAVVILHGSPAPRELN